MNPIDNAIADLLHEIGPDWELRAVTKVGDHYRARIAKGVEPGRIRYTMHEGEGSTIGNAIAMAVTEEMKAELRARTRT